jgi:hypothetical protein
MLIIILLKLENELIKTYECIILVGEMIKLMGLELQFVLLIVLKFLSQDVIKLSQLVES